MVDIRHLSNGHHGPGALGPHPEGLDLALSSSRFILRRWEDIPLEWIRNSIRVDVDEQVALLDVLRGQRSCYIGSDTRVKRQKSPLALVNPDPLEQSALTFGQLLTWVGMHPNLCTLINTLIMEKTCTSPEIVSAADDSIAGGEFEHRGCAGPGSSY